MYPVLWMIGITALCSVALGVTRRDSVAEWIAVRLLAYRDAVQYRKAGITAWKRELDVEFRKPKELNTSTMRLRS